MADALTTTYKFVKPSVSGSPNTWGDKLDTNFDIIDSVIAALAASALPKSGGEIAGNLKVDGTLSSAPAGGVATSNPIWSEVRAALDALVPLGMIMMWSQGVASIPAGWHLCDGTVGTPDFRDKFVVGAGLSYAPLSMGGAATATPVITVAATALTADQMPVHTHGVTDNGHNHSVNDPGHGHPVIVSNNQNQVVQAGGATSNNGVRASNTDSAKTGVNLSPANANITVNNAGAGNPHTHGASSTAISLLPPFIAVCYIMRVA